MNLLSFYEQLLWWFLSIIQFLLIEVIWEKVIFKGFPIDANGSINCVHKTIHFDSEDDQLSIAIVSNNSDEIRDVHGMEWKKRKEIENPCIIQHQKGVRNCPFPSSLTQILKMEKISHNNEEAEENHMECGKNLNKKKDTFLSSIISKQNFKKSSNNNEDAEFDKKSEKIWEKTRTNKKNLNKQKILKSIHDNGIQEKNINSPQTSVINTIIGEFRCNECGKQFLTKDILINHIFKCMKTSVTSQRYSQLTKADTVKSLKSEMYSCNICSFKTKRKVSIIAHFKTHSVHKNDFKGVMRTHTDEKPFSCNICEYRCLYKHQLKYHMRTHTGEKPFSCNICTYRFAQKHHLMRHINTHTGKRPFSCNICQYRFVQKHHLIRHIRTHTGEKPFSCNICEYRCARKHNLQLHMSTHTDDKPYSCNICQFRCSVKRYLNRHMKTHMGKTLLL